MLEDPSTAQKPANEPWPGVAARAGAQNCFATANRLRLNRHATTNGLRQSAGKLSTRPAPKAGLDCRQGLLEVNKVDALLGQPNWDALPESASFSAGSVSSRPITESKRFFHREVRKEREDRGFIHEFSRIDTNEFE
jgi:hypothetical protein